MPRYSGPATTLSITLRQGNSASVWNAKPMPGWMPWTGAPITRTCPADGAARPVTRFSVVDLPQPVGPTTATNSPRATVMLKFRSAVIDFPSGVMKRRLTLTSSIAGSVERWDMVTPCRRGRSVGGQLDVLHELGGVAFRQIDRLALDVGRERRQDAKHRFR